MNDQVTREETAEILRFAEQCLGLEGDFVELGCYRGDTSILLGKLLQKERSLVKDGLSSETALFDDKPNWSLEVGHLSPRKGSRVKRLWIYDSFEGLPEKTREDVSGAGANFQKGELFVTKREVVDKLRKHGLKTASRPDPNASSVVIKKAWFDDLSSQDLPERIAFAFCDGDLYGSIKTSLRLVVPRLIERGIVIVHDYNNPELPGSAQAVDEFLRTHPDFCLKIHYTLAILTKKC